VNHDETASMQTSASEWTGGSLTAEPGEVKHGPVKVEVDADLPAEPRAVWDRMLRWEAQPEWMVDAASVRVVSPLREGTGVRIAVRTRILGVPALTDTLEVTGWDPPRELTMVRNGFVRGTGRWRVEAVPGGTRIEWIEEL